MAKTITITEARFNELVSAEIRMKMYLKIIANLKKELNEKKTT